MTEFLSQQRAPNFDVEKLFVLIQVLQSPKKKLLLTYRGEFDF